MRWTRCSLTSNPSRRRWPNMNSDATRQPCRSTSSTVSKRRSSRHRHKCNSCSSHFAETSRRPIDFSVWQRGLRRFPNSSLQENVASDSGADADLGLMWSLRQGYDRGRFETVFRRRSVPIGRVRSFDRGRVRGTALDVGPRAAHRTRRPALSQVVFGRSTLVISPPAAWSTSQALGEAAGLRRLAGERQRQLERDVLTRSTGCEPLQSNSPGASGHTSHHVRRGV
jgi:hypothetical protein